MKRLTFLSRTLSKEVKRLKKFVKKSTLLKRIATVLVVLPLALPATTINAADSTSVNPVSTPVSVEVKADFIGNIYAPATPTVSFETQESNYQLALAKQRVASKVAVATTSKVVVTDVSLEQKRALAKQAAGAYGIDWKVLEAVWQVESGKSWETNTRSYMNAQGPCQFMSGTWRTYAQDGDGDGIKSITKAQDCLFAAAKLLAVNGASSGNVTRALLAYNHSIAYVNKVMGVANSIQG